MSRFSMVELVGLVVSVWCSMVRLMLVCIFIVSVLVVMILWVNYIRLRSSFIV